MPGLVALFACTLCLFPASAAENDLQRLLRLYQEAMAAGKYEQAIQFASKWEAIALPRATKAFPPAAIRSIAEDNMARAYLQLGNYPKSEELSRSAVKKAEQVFGHNNPAIAEILMNLGNVLNVIGAYGEALKVHLRTIDLFGRTNLGKQFKNFALAQTYSNIGNVYTRLQRWKEAEEAYNTGLGFLNAVSPIKPNSYNPKKSLAAGETVAGRNDRMVSLLMSNMGQLFFQEERYEEGRSLLERALAIDERLKGLHHPELSVPLQNLGLIYVEQQEFDKAASSFRRAAEVANNTTAKGRAALAMGKLEIKRGNPEAAQREYQRSLQLFGQAFGETSLGCEALVALGKIALAAGRYGEAERYAGQCLERVKSTDVESEFNIANSYQLLAGTSEKRGDLADAIEHSRKSLEIRKRLIEFTSTTTLDGVGQHLRLLEEQDRSATGHTERLSAEAFEAAQLPLRSTTAAALQLMGQRAAAGSPELAALVRRKQDLQGEVSALTKQTSDVLARPEAERNATLVAQKREALASKAAELDRVKGRITAVAPSFTELTSAVIVSADEVRHLLAGNEALVFWLLNDDVSYVFAATRERIVWKNIPLTASAAGAKVTNFRKGLDIDGPDVFDLNLAHELYRDLFRPVEATIKDKQHLILVQSSVLSALPMHLLLTEPPSSLPASRGDVSAYKAATWLMKRSATSVLPSVSGLKMLRGVTQRSPAARTMVGFGDPVFGTGQPSTSRVASRSVSLPYTSFWKGVGVDKSKLATTLPRLADTADELNTIADTLSVSRADIHLRNDATEKLVKTLDLSEFRIVYFATHGLVAGDVKGLAEPSLALTIPQQPTELDDGLLTSSEVAQLKLNADWVVLSACNTIAGDKPGAEALSGLTRSFLYAGARALLVSHWPVESAATTRLTTTAFNLLKDDPSLGRASAMRAAMLRFLEKPTTAEAVHPGYWGPFVVVGEGGAR